MKLLMRLFATLSFGFSIFSHGTVISLSPNTLDLEVGQQLVVDINVNGLGQSSAPSISTFDIDLVFDQNLFSVDEVIFSDQLNLLGLGQIESAFLPLPGVLNMFALSFDFPLDLDSFQASDFTLASVTLNSLSPGMGLFNAMVNDIGNSLGDPLQYSVVNGSAIVNVATPKQVSEPNTKWLLAFAFLALVLSVRKQAQNS